MADKQDLFESEEFNRFLEGLARKTIEASKGIYIPNMKRQKLFYSSLEALKRAVDINNAEITYDIHNDPFDGSGSISIVGNRIQVTNPSLFAEIASRASNIDFYPRIDGCVDLDLMYYRLFDKIGNAD